MLRPHASVITRGLLLAGFALAAGTGPALAQVTTNSNALDALGGAPPPAAAPAPHDRSTAPAAQPHRNHPRTAPAAPRTAPPSPIATAAPPRPAPPLPPALVGPPPPAPVLAAPVVNVPLHPAPMPPSPAFEADGPGEQNRLADDRGLRLSYAPGSAALNNVTNGAIVGYLVPLLRAHPQSRIEIDAFAPAVANDESAARRLSLQRGLGVRSVLMHEGIPATRIYVRALGNTQPPGLPGETGANHRTDLPPDRVEAALVGEDAAVPAQSAAQDKAAGDLKSGNPT